eukprot:756011-Hanusia_phi.AAC.5
MARLWDTSRQGRGGYKLSSLMQDLLGWGKTDMKEVNHTEMQKRGGRDREGGGLSAGAGEREVDEVEDEE